MQTQQLITEIKRLVDGKISVEMFEPMLERAWRERGDDLDHKSITALKSLERAVFLYNPELERHFDARFAWIARHWYDLTHDEPAVLRGDVLDAARIALDALVD